MARDDIFSPIGFLFYPGVSGSILSAVPGQNWVAINGMTGSVYISGSTIGSSLGFLVSPGDKLSFNLCSDLYLNGIGGTATISVLIGRSSGT